MQNQTSHTYAEPLTGLQVSWGSLLAGAVTTLAVSMILWAIALAIILTASSPTLGSIKDCLIAAWICGMVTTLIGAFAGGAVAGYLPGSRRRLMGGIHGFLSWGVAFVVASLLQWSLLGGALRATASTVAGAASTAVQTTGAAVGGAVGGAVQGESTLEQKAYSVLISIGYTPAEARDMVESARDQMSQVVHGRATPPQVAAGPVTARVKGAVDTLLAWAAGMAWAWMGVWLVSAGLSILGGILATDRTRRAPPLELEREAERPATPAPLEPAPGHT